MNPVIVSSLNWVLLFLVFVFSAWVCIAIRNLKAACTPQDSDLWIQSVQSAHFALPSEESIIESGRTWDDARAFVARFSYEIDLSARLAKRKPAILDDEAVAALFEMRDRRQKLLNGITSRLDTHVPDIRVLLKEFPIEASSIAFLALLVVGSVWACGSYGVRGIAVLPLIRDLEDLAMIGFGAGLVPFTLFALMVILVLHTARTARKAADDDDASAALLLNVITRGEKLSMRAYWCPRAVTTLLIVLLIGVAHGLLSKYLYIKSVVRTGELGVLKLQIAGGIGSYIVGIDESHTPVIIPAGDIQCMEAGSDESACKASAKSRSTAATPISLTIKGDAVEQTWTSFAKRVGQCEVVSGANSEAGDAGKIISKDGASVQEAGKDSRPLLSPTFADNDGANLDSSYYDRWPAKWPFENGRSERKNRKLESAADELSAVLIKYIPPDPTGFSVNLVGFASGTGDPSANQILAQKRANRIAGMLSFPGRRICSVDARGKPLDSTDCLQIRPLIVGEMFPNIDFGLQGEASNRRVLLFVCKADLF